MSEASTPDGTGAGADSARHQAAAELVDRYWSNVWINRDLSVIDELYTNPTVRHTASGSRTVSHDELKAALAEALRVMRGESFSVDQLTVLDDVAWLRLTLRGVSLANLEPTAIVWLAQYRLVENQIAETWALHQSALDWAKG